MKVTYIHHSSFLVETENELLIFDYYEGGIPELPEGKPLYVFASHRHPDHFSKVIFEKFGSRPGTTFVISSDIWRKRIPEELRDQTVFLKPGMKEQIGEIQVETLKSTDEGVAFWCTASGHEIYHAGDLNHWYWEEETAEWNRKMTEAYRSEIRKLAGRKADLAMIPADPRLGKWFYLGIDDFMKEADAAYIFPMHFWEQYDICGKLKEQECAERYRDRIMEIEAKGQRFDI